MRVHQPGCKRTAKHPHLVPLRGTLHDPQLPGPLRGLSAGPPARAYGRSRAGGATPPWTPRAAPPVPPSRHGPLPSVDRWRGGPPRAIWSFDLDGLREPRERAATPFSWLRCRPGVGHPKKTPQTAVFHGFAIRDLGPAFLREKFQKEIGQLERGQAARLVHRRASVPLQRRRWADLGTARTGGCPPWVGSEVVHGHSGLLGAAVDHPHAKSASKISLFVSLFLCLLCYNFSSSKEKCHASS